MRAVAAHLVAYGRGHSAESIAKAYWPDDHAAASIVRAAVSPATTTTSGWASQLASSSVADFLANLGPASAGSALLQRGMQLQFKNGSASVVVPGVVAAASGASYVGEGAPIPVRQLTTSALTLSPKKLATISVYTREMLERTNIEAVVRAVLVENAALALDGVMFGAGAGDATTPAGLRNGVSALTAASGGGFNAMVADIVALTETVWPVANGDIVFVAAPGTALRLSLSVSENFPYLILPTNALSAGTLMAVAPSALASAVEPTPEIDVTEEASLVMADDAGAFSTAGTPNVVSAPSKSTWQSGLVSLRLLLTASFGLRTTGAVAWVEDVTW